MTSPLESLARQGGPLAVEPPDDAEIAGLVRSGRLRLADARNPSLSIDSRFDLAYNAAHALSLAALRSRGYRARHRYIVCRIRWVSGPRFGACSPRRMTCATWQSTKGMWMWVSGWYAISSKHAKPWLRG
mgnify:CR=1 FL=1